MPHILIIALLFPTITLGNPGWRDEIDKPKRGIRDGLGHGDANAFDHGAGVAPLPGALLSPTITGENRELTSFTHRDCALHYRWASRELGGDIAVNRSLTEY